MSKQELLDGFDVSDLEPFGIEIRSRRGVTDIEQWVSESIDDITLLMRQKSLVVIRDAYPFQEHECNTITAPVQQGSTSMFHVDQRGTVDMLLWQTNGRHRADTAFVQSHDLKSASLDTLHLLDSTLEEKPYNNLIGSLQELLLAAKGDPDSFQPNHIHTIFRRLVIDQRMRSAMPKNDRGIIDRLMRAWNMQQVVEKEVEAALSDNQTDRIQRLIAAYSDSVNERLLGNVYTHQWSEKPDSAVIAYNKIDQDDAMDSAVFHRGVPRSEASTNTLLRMQINNGKLQPSPTHGFH